MKWKFEHTDYGLKIIFKGRFEEKDFTAFYDSLLRYMVSEIKPSINFKDGFKVLTDVRELEPFNGFGTAIFKDAQTFLLKVGLIKSAKIVTKDFQKLWAKIISSNTKMEKKEKYFENEEDALKWLKGENK